ncbi:MAG: ABC transporter ATP-binding protein/permease [Anaerolineae bacterium]|nr:ABC transporter ATP-binding protein/permease [Anaerolineae bacterium]
MSDEHRFEEEEFSSQFNGGTVRRLLKQLLPYKGQVALFLACAVGVSFMESYFTLLSKQIVDDGIVAGNADLIGRLALQYGLLMVGFAAMVFVFIYICGRLGHQVQYDLRKRMFEHLQRLSFSYYDRTPVGWMMSRLTSDPERVSNVLTWGLLDVTWAVTNILVSMLFMLTISWQLTLIVAAILPVILVVAVWFKQRMLVEYRDSRKYNSMISGEFNQNITGVRVVKSMRRENANLEEFKGLTGSMHRSSYRGAWLSAMFLPSVQIISAVAVAAVAWYGGWQTSIGGMTIGGIQAFVAYITFMMWPVSDVARVYAEMQHAIASAERMFSLLDSQPEVVDRPNATDPGTLRGDIVFENVDFYYDPAKPVLKDFNLTIKQGETIALVGATGGGKSTIVNLVCRFYEPRNGRILMGGQDYTTMPLSAIHSRLGMVLQTPHLFSGTIRENIRYGRLDATDAEVEQAAHLSGAHAFVSTLEKGYDEEVGEGGILLSVGQKQLLSLARAILADPEIFVMDEATSSVDTLTEALIQQGMEAVMRGRTSFVIAHRLSTVKKADRIIVIANGTIQEMGSHAELLRQRGYYYNLYTQQFRQELERSYDEVFNLKPAGEGELQAV